MGVILVFDKIMWNQKQQLLHACHNLRIKYCYLKDKQISNLKMKKKKKNANKIEKSMEGMLYIQINCYYLTL